MNLLIAILLQFTPVWSGNGYGHMNIYIVEHDLHLSDTLAVYSQNRCVGVSVANTEQFDIIASADDGTGNGFAVNDTIVFVTSRNTPLAATYSSELPHWSMGRYEQGGSAFVRLTADVVTRNRTLPYLITLPPGTYDLFGRKLQGKPQRGVVYVMVGHGKAVKFLCL